MRRNNGFTLIELLIVIAIIAILAVVVVLVLNPGQLLAQGRDSNRLSDLGTVSNAISVYQTDGFGPLGTADTVYVSIPDPAATSTAGDACQGLGLTALPSPWVYHCPASATAKNVNGTGWLPIDLTKISSGNPLTSLPVDPTDASSSCLFYTYETNGTTQYEITAALESKKYGAGGSENEPAADGGQYADMYEKGTSLTLLPLDIVSSTPSCASTANVAGGTSGGTVAYGITPGTPVNVSSTNGTPISLTFAGTAGVTVTIAGSNESGVYWSGNGATISIANPNGTTMVSGLTGWSPYTVVTTTPTTGNYTFKITMPSGTGAATFTLTQPTTTLLVMGTPRSITSLPGQTTDVDFTGTAGQTVTVAATGQSGVYWSGSGSPWTVTEPDGATTLWSGWTGTGAMMVTSTLPESGTYDMHLTTIGGGTGAGGGSMTFVYSPLVTSTISMGTMVAVSTTLPGQMQNITFSGTAGQTIFLTAASQADFWWHGSGVPVTLISPSGTSLGTIYTGNAPYLITSTLPATGTYTIQIRPATAQSGYTGSANLVLDQPLAGTIAVGSPYSASVALPGQYVDLSYSGTAGQTIAVTASAQSGVYWNGSGTPFYLISPTGTVMSSGWSGTGSYSIPSTTLPATGTYTIELRPPSGPSWTGAAKFTLTSS